MIRVPPYKGVPVKCPSREVNSDMYEDTHFLLVDDVKQCSLLLVEAILLKI